MSYAEDSAATRATTSRDDTDLGHVEAYRKPAVVSLETKSAVTGVKVLDEGQGIVQAIVSVTNIVDQVNDRILPGSYAETLTKRMPKGLRGHDWHRMVAKTLQAEELMPGDPRIQEISRKISAGGGGGLLIRGQYNLNTTMGRDAYEDAKFFGDEMEWCQDQETEILTDSGWLRYDQVTTEDRAYTLDLDTLSARFEPILAVNVWPEKTRWLRKLESKGHSSLSTAAHRWPVRGAYKGQWKWKTTDQLNSSDFFLRATGRADAPMMAKWSDAFVELVAWHWTEGWEERNAAGGQYAYIGQSESHPAEVGAIRAALENEFPGGWTETSRNGMVRFRLRAEPTMALLGVLSPHKAPTPQFLCDLTAAQLRLLIERCLDGDGTRRRDGRSRCWYQVEDHSVRIFEMACALAGIATSTIAGKSYGNRHGRPPQTVFLVNSATVNPMAAAKRQGDRPGPATDQWVERTGIVWCPTTPSGTWLARRNGTVYFTGNSVGYKVPRGKSAIVPRTGTREIKTMDLYEWSDVAFGAAPLTAGTTSIKAIDSLEVKALFIELVENGELTADEIKDWSDLWIEEGCEGGLGCGLSDVRPDVTDTLAKVMEKRYGHLEPCCEACGSKHDPALDAAPAERAPGGVLDALELKVDKVATEKGVRKYDAPVGTPIVAGRAIQAAKKKPPSLGDRLVKRQEANRKRQASSNDTLRKAGAKKPKAPDGPNADTPDGPDAPNADFTPEELAAGRAVAEKWKLSPEGLAANEELNPDFPGLSKMGPPDVTTDDVDEALAALAEGKNVELNQPDKVATLLNRLQQIVADAKSKGEKAPDYNLCQVSVAGSNLFCAEHKGETRITMPQLTGIPLPGSKAETLLAEANAAKRAAWLKDGKDPAEFKPDVEVNISNEFRDYLKSEGLTTKLVDAPAARLHATQKELVGANVAGMMSSLANTNADGSAKAEGRTFVPGAIFVSANDYVIDGHHTWAAKVGVDAMDGELGDVTMQIEKVNVNIETLLAKTVEWTTMMGVPPKGGGKGSGAAAVAAQDAKAGVKAWLELEFDLETKGLDPKACIVDELRQIMEETGGAIADADLEWIVQRVAERLAAEVDTYDDETKRLAAHVRTTAGHRKYGESIGELIKPDFLPGHGGTHRRRAPGRPHRAPARATPTVPRKPFDQDASTTTTVINRNGVPVTTHVYPDLDFVSIHRDIEKAGGLRHALAEDLNMVATIFMQHLMGHSSSVGAFSEPGFKGADDELELSDYLGGLNDDEWGAVIDSLHGSDLQAVKDINDAVDLEFKDQPDVWEGDYRAAHLAHWFEKADDPTIPDDELAAAGMTDVDVEVKVSSRALPPLERVPGKQNWVDKTGGLPDYIDRIAKHLVSERGMTVGHAIATAVNRVKKWASGVGNVNPDTRAKAAKAVAEWEAKKVASRAMTAAKKAGKSGGKGGGDSGKKDDAVDIEQKILGAAAVAAARHHQDLVRTQAGVDRFGRPIGSPIAPHIPHGPSWSERHKMKKWNARIAPHRVRSVADVTALERASRAGLDPREVMASFKIHHAHDPEEVVDHLLKQQAPVHRLLGDDLDWMVDGRAEGYYASIGKSLDGIDFTTMADEIDAEIRADIKAMSPAELLATMHEVADEAKGHNMAVDLKTLVGDDDGNGELCWADYFDDATAVELKAKKHRFMGKGEKCGICKLTKDAGAHIGASDPTSESPDAKKKRDDAEEEDGGAKKKKWVPPWKKQLDLITEHDVAEMKTLLAEWESKDAGPDDDEDDEDEEVSPDAEVVTGDEDILDEEASDADTDPDDGDPGPDEDAEPAAPAPAPAPEPPTPLPSDQDPVDHPAPPVVGDGQTGGADGQMAEVGAKADALDTENKAGRMLSSTNATAIKSALEQLVTVLTRAGVVTDEVGPKEGKEGKAEEKAQVVELDDNGEATITIGSGQRSEDGTAISDDDLVHLSLADLMEAAELRLTANI